MKLSEEQANEVLDFVDQMEDLVELVKRIERGSGLIENFQKALEIASKTKVNHIRNIVINGTKNNK